MKNIIERAKKIRTKVPVVIPTLDGTEIAERIEVEVEAMQDPKTGEIFLDGYAMEELDRVKARHMGLLSPEEIRQLRNAHELTQKELSILLQMGEKTVTRWESGNDRPSRSLNILLRALWDGELTVDYLNNIQAKPHKSMPAPPLPEWIALVTPKYFSFEAPEPTCHEPNSTAA